MSIASKIKTVIKKPKVILQKIMALKVARLIPDEVALKIHYRLQLGEKLSLNSPKTFNEKIQWLKINNRKPEYTAMVDKYAVKKIIADIIGEEYIIPTIAGPFERFEDIDFDVLPDQFVIKCTHDSAGLVICRDKSKLDKEAAKVKIENSLKNNFYWRYREWVYKDIKPQIIVEKYMEDNSPSKTSNALVDYKFFTFNGETKFLYISEGMENQITAQMAFFDLEGNMMPFKRLDYNGFKVAPQMPDQLDKMVEISDLLAKKIGAPFLRVDLYEINGQIYFGEVTFYPHAGFIPIEPREYDKVLGDMMTL